MRNVITGLSAGIIALACNSILSQYFIGSGKIRYSAGSSFVGLISLLVSGYLLIPSYGVVGSAISSSIAFSTMLAFSMIIFCWKTGARRNTCVNRSRKTAPGSISSFLSKAGNEGS